MSAAFTFAIALILLGAFIAFRFAEEKRGRRIWANMRDSADVVVSDMYTAAVRGDVPEKYRTMLVGFFHMLAHDAVSAAVEALRAAERPLERLSRKLRHGAPAGNGKEPSAFLKTLTPEKRPEETSAATTDSL